jgi:hypothetical protein
MDTSLGSFLMEIDDDKVTFISLCPAPSKNILAALAFTYVTNRTMNQGIVS